MYDINADPYIKQDTVCSRQSFFSLSLQVNAMSSILILVSSSNSLKITKQRNRKIEEKQKFETFSKKNMRSYN